METLRILRSVRHVRQDPVRNLERFARLVSQEKCLLLVDLVSLVRKIKETLDQLIAVMLVLLERLPSKEVSVYDVLKARSVEREDDVKLVLQDTNLIVLKRTAWNVLKEPSRPMESLVFHVLRARSPQEQELFSACCVLLVILRMRLEPIVLLAQRDSVLWQEETVCNVCQEAQHVQEVCVNHVQLGKETPRRLLENVLLVLQDGVPTMEESVSSVLWDKIPILEACARTVSQDTVRRLVACVNLVRLDRARTLEASV